VKERRSERWLVLGAGATGAAAAARLAAAGATVAVTDDRADALSAAELPTAVQRIAAADVRIEEWTMVLSSPGIAPSHRLVAAAEAAGKLRGDLDLWQDERTACTIAVTGTNGKSTVTRLIAAMLREGGFVVAEGGNLGTPAPALLDASYDRAVLEVSSFQLYYGRSFLPEVMVLTNIAPDHLDWHPDEGHYIAAKRGVFECLGAEQTAILPAEAAFADWAGRAMRLRFGHSADADVRVDGGEIVVHVARNNWRLVIPADFPMPHQRLNLAAAVAAAVVVGVDSEAIMRAAQSFKHLPYRLCKVREVGGVEFWNDSKATNLHAMIAAVQAFPEAAVHLLAGGKRKGLDWAAAAPHLAPHVRQAYAYGEAGDDIHTAWQDRIAVTRVDDLTAAFAAAAAAARPGEAVLLAPGTSSFDAFSSYKERGAFFDALVSGLAEGSAV
jgi:UDP-N-acetylmuramoylalanine--D-glutamate ligase